MDKEDLAKNDSVQKYLKLAGNDTLDFKQRDKFNDKAFSFVDLNKNDTLTRFYLCMISFNSMKTQDKVFFNNVGKIHYEKSQKAKDTLNLARYYRYRAGYFKNMFINDSSLYYYVKAEKFYRKTNDKLGLAIVYQNKGDLQFDNYDCLGAEISSLKAYIIYKNNNNKERLGFILNQLGLIYIELEEFNNAIKYFNDALNITKDFNSKDNNFRAIILSNIGLVFHRQKKYSQAINKYISALKILEKKRNYKIIYSNTIDNLVACKLSIGDYSNLHNFLFESLEIRKQINEPSAIIASLIDISQYYNAKHDFNLAKDYAKEALERAQVSSSRLDYLQALKQISIIDIKYSKSYYEEYIRVSDSLQLAERKTRNNFARIQLETDELKQEKKIAVKHKWIVGIIAVVVVFITILLLIITKQRSKQKELKLLQSQQKANDEIYDLMLSQKSNEDLVRQEEKKRIALELHDGVMNRLASTRLNLGILSHKNDLQTIKKCMIEIDGIYYIEQEIRSIAHDLNTEIFNEKNSFISLLKDFIVTQNKITNTHYTLEIDESIKWNYISSNTKMNLYRIIQEASHNINKFAEASKATISFIIDKNHLCLSITDNGKGFNPKTNSEGIGLKNIKLRVKSINGNFFIQSKENKSTSLTVIFPIQ